jgi:signal transduction histidine kinase/DNA-binding response OmpR family regulator/ligand-binding sensor domain-containing protein
MGGGMNTTKYLQIRNNSTFKEIIFIFGFLFFGFFFLIPQNLHCESTGFKYSRYYSYEEYDHLAQNWGMVQSPNGIIYVANHGGVLEYDGVSWRIIGIPGYDTVRSIAIDKNGTVFIGGINKIGYLAPDEKGSLKYVSLLKHLDDNFKNFLDVWSTHATEAGIYFRTTKFLFRWDYKEIKVWPTPNSFKASFVFKGDFIVQELKKGLLKIVDDSMRPLPGTGLFSEKKIYPLVSQSNNSRAGTMAMVVSNQGLFLYDGEKVTPFPKAADDYLHEMKLNHGIQLETGDWALATSQGSLVIIDPHGGLKDTISNIPGLEGQSIYYLFEDIQKNLWLCLSKGILKIEYSSPISIYDERSNLSGIVLSVVKHQNDLYAGTTNGLFKLGSPAEFRLMHEMSTPCWSLVSTGNSLLAATNEGVFHIKKDIKRIVIKDISFVLLPSKLYPGLTWCGTYKDLVAISSKDGEWMEEHRLININQEIRSITEDKNGNLWLGIKSGGILKVDFPRGTWDPVVTHYHTANGLPEGEINGSSAAGHIVFTTAKGLFRFDEKSNMFIPDLMLGKEFSGGSKPVFRVVEDKNKHIWFHSESRNFQAVPGPGSSFTINAQPFLRIPATAQVNAIYPDPDGKAIWFASQEGLIRYDTTVRKNYQQTFYTLIRRALINEKQEYKRQIFEGFLNKGKTGKAGSVPFPLIKYRDRNLHFEFAAPFFDAETETRYQCFLEGYDNHRSGWSKDSKRNYTNLDPGLYSFRVRAKNIYNHLGEEDIFKFKILPPWYRTWWAYLLYGASFLLLMFLVVKWRSHKLEREKQKLEQIIKERTKEIQEKNLQLKDQSDKLKEMDRVKSRFFANISHEFRTPLTLIMSPLEQLQSELKGKQHKETLGMMLRSSQRLLTLINQLLELSKIDSGKLKLQAVEQDIVPFLKGTLAAFDVLARQNELKLEFLPVEEVIPLYFDTPKMEEAMHNLIINAVKFTPPGGKITVSVFKDQQETLSETAAPKRYINISVRDTGVGISQEQIIHIFDRFYQAENPKIRSHKGTGIGLALTKEIVALHHGIINAHSQEGQGTEFVIRLPMGHEHLKPNEIANSTAQSPKLQKAKEIETLYLTRETETETDEEDDRDKREEGAEDIDKEKDKTEEQMKPVILVVEDDVDVRKYICGSLKSGYTFVEAADGKEGIEKAKEMVPDLIVSDIMMPGPDGYELCKELKNDILTSHIPIILLTAKASEESIIQGLKTGADDYITKPFNSKILAVRIKNLIDLRKQLQLKLQRDSLKIPSEIKLTSMDAQFLKKFREIIEANLSDEDFNINALCKKLGMKRANLFKKIKALTGETPNQFIVSYRLDRGAQLLRENYGNVTEVAMAVGFTSPAYFTRCFKEKFHISPSTYQVSESGPRLEPESS